MKEHRKDWRPSGDHLVVPANSLNANLPYNSKSVMGEYLLKYHPDKYKADQVGNVIPIVAEREGEYNTHSTTF